MYRGKGDGFTPNPRYKGLGKGPIDQPFVRVIFHKRGGFHALRMRNAVLLRVLDRKDVSRVL